MRLERLLTAPYYYVSQVVREVEKITRKMTVIYVRNVADPLEIPKLGHDWNDRFSLEVQREENAWLDPNDDTDPFSLYSLLKHYSDEVKEKEDKQTGVLDCMNKMTNSLSVHLCILFCDLKSFSNNNRNPHSENLFVSLDQAISLLDGYIFDMSIPLVKENEAILENKPPILKEDSALQSEEVSVFPAFDLNEIDPEIPYCGLAYLSTLDELLEVLTDLKSSLKRMMFLSMSDLVGVSIAFIEAKIEKLNPPMLPCIEFSNIIARYKGAPFEHTNFVPLDGKAFDFDQLNKLFCFLIHHIEEYNLNIEAIQWGELDLFKLNYYFNFKFIDALDEIEKNIQQALNYGQIKNELRQCFYFLLKDVIAARMKLDVVADSEFYFDLRLTKKSLQDVFYTIETICHVDSISLEGMGESEAKLYEGLERVATEFKWPRFKEEELEVPAAHEEDIKKEKTIKN